MKEGKLYGSRKREANRKQNSDAIKKVINERMPSFIRKHLPSLHVPPFHEYEYEQELKHFLRFLQETYTDILYLRAAYSYLSSFIAQGNHEGKWSLAIPPILIPSTRSKSHVNRASFINSKKISAIHKAWRDNIRTSIAPPFTHQERLADVLISAIFYGGLARKDAVVSLANSLLEEEKAIKISNQLMWIDLYWNSNKDAINSSDTGSTYLCFYLDNITLGLINSLYQVTPTAVFERYDGNKVWEIIRKRLTGLARLDISFNTFCQNALYVTEMLDNVSLSQLLIECATGRVQTSSLTPQQMRVWLNNSSKLQRLSSGVSFNETEQFSPKKTIHKPADVDVAYDIFIKEVREGLRLYDSYESRLKRTSKQALEELRTIDKTSLALNEKLLLGWLINQLEDLKVSSVYRYFSEIYLVWLYSTHEIDFFSLDELDLENVYLQMLNNKTDAKSRNYLLGRLYQLHGYVSQTLGLPPLNSFFNQNYSQENTNRINVGYIPYNAYVAIRDEAYNTPKSQLHSNEQFGLACMIILAYRTGLRISELLKLRLIDVEESEEIYLFVVNNRYGDNKTSSSRRKIPVKSLLLADEFNTFRKYFQLRKNFHSSKENYSNVLLFSFNSTPNQPFSKAMVNKFVKESLEKYGIYGLTFHHLRHSALTNVFLALEDPDREFLVLDAYPNKNLEEIKSGIFSESNLSSRDKYWSIATLAGHLTPEVTFSTYIHCVDLILYKQISKYNPSLSVSEARYITGLSTTKLNRFKQDDGNMLLLCHLRGEIEAKLSKHCDRVGPQAKILTQVREQTNVENQVKADVEACYRVLSLIESGHSISEVSAKYYLDENYIERWINQARKLHDLKTIHGNKRLFSKIRLRQAKQKEQELLLPSKPVSNAELIMVKAIVQKIRDVYLDNKGGIFWMIRYWLHNSSPSTSGIRFNSLENYNKFLNAACLFVSPSQWKVVVHYGGQINQKHWQYKNLFDISFNRKQGIKMPFALLYLKHPNDDNIIKDRNAEMNKYSSSALRYLFHMLAIMLDIDLVED